MTTERVADHIKFAYWVPNVSGGLVTSDIEQRTRSELRVQREARPNRGEQRVHLFQQEIEYFGSRVLLLVREIEDSEEDSVGEPVLASA